MKNISKKVYLVIGCLVITVVVTFFVLNSSRVQATELTKNAKHISMDGKDSDEKFGLGSWDFSFDMLKATAEKKKDENLIISPYSLLSSLSMVSNGAKGNTKSEMEKVLGNMSVEEMNRYLYQIRTDFPDSSKIRIKTANSIWINQNAKNRVIGNFLSIMDSCYDAECYTDEFSPKIIDDINRWVSIKTDKGIKKVLRKNEDLTNTDMFLVNTVFFDGKWKTKYKNTDIEKGIFTNFDGKEKKVSFMESTEKIYVENDDCKGFLKPYYGEEYYFFGILPNEDKDINAFIKEMNGEKMQELLYNQEEWDVRVSIPKFTQTYEGLMNDVLKNMGIREAFSPELADFTGMFTDKGDYLSKVIHKSKIEVDENGTKAFSVTVSKMESKSAVMYTKEINLNRPFMYGIIKKDGNVPLFIGISYTME